MADKTDNIKTRLQFDGEREYKENCAQISQNLKILSSELKVTTAEYANNGNGIDALRAKQNVLKKTFDEQAAKVKETEKALQSMKYAQGEDSDGAKRLEIALNKAKAEMIATGNQVKDLDEKMKSAGKSSSNFGDKIKSGMSGLGSGIATGAKAAGASIAAMGTATVAAAAAGGKMVMSSVQTADELQRLSDVTGMTAEQIQVMKYQGSALGVEFDTIAGAQAKLTKSMAAAEGGTGAQAKAFQELGISVKDGTGHLRNSTDVMNDAITKLGSIKNPTERDAMAMQIFGKSAMQLNPLIKAGGAQLAAMSDEAKKNGAVMSNEAVAGLDNFGDSLDAAKLSVKGMAGTLSAAALPMLNQFTKLIGETTGALNTAIKTGDFSQLGTTLSEGISSAATQLTGMITKLVPVATKILTGLVSALVKAIPTVLPALANGVVQLIQSAAQILQANGPMIIKAGIEAIMTLIQGLAQALPQLIQAAVTTITALANSLTSQLPTLIPVAVNAIITIVNGLIDNLPQILNAAIDIIVALVQGIMNALPQLVAEVPKIIIGIINGITAALPKLIDAAPKIIVSIITGIINAIPQLVAAAPQIILAVIKGVGSALPQLLTLGPKMIVEVGAGLMKQDWAKLGTDIMKGIADGFGNIGNWIWGKIQDAGNAIVNGFKSFFGIHSPSTLMRDEIGTYLGLGVADGIQKTDFMAGVPTMVTNAKRKINAAMSGITGDVTGNININGTSQSSGADQGNQGGIIKLTMPVYLNEGGDFVGMIVKEINYRNRQKNIPAIG